MADSYHNCIRWSAQNPPGSELIIKLAMRHAVLHYSPMFSLPLLFGALSAISVVSAVEESLLVGGVQGINRFIAAKASAQSQSLKQAADFPVFNFTQPLDHFDSAYEGFTWNQRYWVSTRNYNGADDAPVIVLDAGETSGMPSQNRVLSVN